MFIFSFHFFIISSSIICLLTARKKWGFCAEEDEVCTRKHCRKAACYLSVVSSTATQRPRARGELHSREERERKKLRQPSRQRQQRRNGENSFNSGLLVQVLKWIDQQKQRLPSENHWGSWIEKPEQPWQILRFKGSPERGQRLFEGLWFACIETSNCE